MNSYQVDPSSSSRNIEEFQNLSSSNHGNSQVESEMTSSLRDDPILKHLLIELPSRQHQHGIFTPGSYQRELEIPSGTGSEGDVNTPTNDSPITSWGSETNEPVEQRVPRVIPVSLLNLFQRISQRYQDGVFGPRPSDRVHGSFEGPGDYFSRSENRSASDESEVDWIYPMDVEEGPVLEIHIEESPINRT
ncbi:uncharacterized protein MELLADRAFT_103117 [Melampsora larici-populina 98AG31]|uniref:Uncharacterized protein n=1 Tax=Melampsora larici-populina (strain 98AG31 / pathotype 3-4-7) TaxID=747676 RepID=F4RAL6_MELLP|nr:uncharacterized protein MELLADRAFT_103117 [Melampsora larici-populina 98AG31]EGG10501.1 hypothetical protein MELLADRAFT_103117 [Melampsora larici-populina 98AG31]